MDHLETYLEEDWRPSTKEEHLVSFRLLSLIFQGWMTPHPSHQVESFGGSLYVPSATPTPRFDHGPDPGSFQSLSWAW